MLDVTLSDALELASDFGQLAIYSSICDSWRRMSKTDGSAAFVAASSSPKSVSAEMITSLPRERLPARPRRATSACRGHEG